MTLSKLDLLDRWDEEAIQKLYYHIYTRLNPVKKTLVYMDHRKGVNHKMSKVRQVIPHYDIDEIITSLQTCINSPRTRHKYMVPVWENYIKILKELKCTLHT